MFWISGSLGNFGKVLRRSDHSIFFSLFACSDQVLGILIHWERHEALKEVTPRQEGEQSPSLRLGAELDKTTPDLT